MEYYLLSSTDSPIIGVITSEDWFHSRIKKCLEDHFCAPVDLVEVVPEPRPGNHKYFDVKIDGKHHSIRIERTSIY